MDEGGMMSEFTEGHSNGYDMAKAETAKQMDQLKTDIKTLLSYTAMIEDLDPEDKALIYQIENSINQTKA